MQPEHLGTVIARTMNGGGNRQRSDEIGALSDALRGQPRTLSELVRFFEREEAHENPDVTVATGTLTVTDTGLLRIPKVGDFSFTDWSKRQAANLVGVRVDSWLKQASGRELADAMNRHLARARGEVRLRTTKPVEPGPGSAAGADGVLRAFVSPAYAVVPDSSVGRALLATLTPERHDLPLLRFEVTDRSTCFVIGTHASAAIPQLGQVQGGVIVRNSGTAFASLVVLVHLTWSPERLGTVAPIPDARLLTKRHRGGHEPLQAWLALETAELSAKIARGIDRLAAAREHRVDDTARELRLLLQARRLPSRFLPDILTAHRAAEHPTAQSLAEALARAAAAQLPEERLELETAAGAYLTTP